MKSFVLLMLTLNAQTGEPLAIDQIGEPMTMEACLEAQVAQGVYPVKDGKAAIFVCGNIVASEAKPI